MRFKITSDETTVKEQIIDYFASNCTCKIVDEDYDISIEIYLTYKKSNMMIRDNNIIIHAGEDISIKDFCDKIIEMFNIDSINLISKCKDIESITKKEEKIAINYDKVNNVISRGIDDPYVPEESAKIVDQTNSSFYSVRRSLNDAASEKWCSESLTAAIRECDKYAGYKVFSDTGDLIYTSKKYKVALEKKNVDYIDKTRFIRNNGAGIKVKNKDLKLINIPDGTKVIVSKISSKVSEIIIHLDDGPIKTEVATSILSRL